MIRDFINLLVVDMSDDIYKQIYNNTKGEDLDFLVEMILRSGIALEHRINALKFAIKYEWMGAIELIISYDTNDSGVLTNILLETNAGGNALILKLLHQNGADLKLCGPHLLVKSAKSGWESFMAYLLDNLEEDYLDVFPIASSPYPLILIATKENNLNIIKVLYKRGANLGIHNNAILLLGARHNYIEIVTHLLKKGLDINSYNEPETSNAKEFGISALINSCASGHYEMTKLLLKKKADINICDQKALIQSITHHHPKITKLLLKNGSDPNIIYEYPAIIERLSYDYIGWTLQILVRAGLNTTYHDNILFKKCTLNNNIRGVEILLSPPITKHKSYQSMKQYITS
jgi:hypothetical protein